MKKFIPKIVMAFIAVAGLPLFAGCDSDEGDDVSYHIFINDEGTELKDVPGSISFIEGEPYFKVADGYVGPFATVIDSASHIKIVNWKPEFEEYEGEKCVVSGVFKRIASKGTPTYTLLYVELTISSIKHCEEI